MLLRPASGGSGALLASKIVGEVPSGLKNGSNDTYFTSVDFLQIAGGEFQIRVRWNDRVLTPGDDFIALESGGLGTGYDSIQLLYPTKPVAKDTILVDFYPA